MTSERTCHFTGDDAWKCGTHCTCQHFNWNNKGQTAMTSECKHRSYQTVPMNGRKCNDCGRWLDDEETAMTSECLWCGAERELRLGCCFDCATTGEERAAQRTVAEHIAKGFNNLAKRNGCAKHDFKWAWERLTNTGDYAPNGYFAAFGIQTRRQP